MDDKPIRTSDELPEPKVVEGDWKFWQGHYKLACTIKHTDGTTTRKDGGFVPHDGWMWMAIGPNEKLGFGFSRKDAQKNAEAVG